MSKKKKVALHNLGCKVNAYEAEAMAEKLEKNGYELVKFTDFADIYIVNTCTVTNVASRKSRQMLQRAKKVNPKAIVVAAGCYIQIAEDEKKVDHIVDVIIGNNRKQDLIEILHDLFLESKSTLPEVEESESALSEAKGNESNLSQVKGSSFGNLDLKRTMRKEVININKTREYENLKLSKPRAHTRVNVKVQDGCNQFCAYCIIPMVRGRSRSRALEDVIEEVGRLSKSGCREVVLTGIHLSSYGIDLGGVTLLDLVKEIHQFPEIARIRLGSLEPKIISREFVEKLSTLEKFCPHFHLSLQSGCDKILGEMNRHYTSDEYFKKCQLIREYFKHPSITTDIIVGFPGESDEDFAVTKAFVEKVGFYETHIFKYSKREGTVAAKLPNQVSGKVKSKRSDELNQMNIKKRKEYESYFLGKKVEVLVEGKVKVNGEEVQVGCTKEYVKIRVDSKENLKNQLISVNIIEESQFVH